MVIVTVNFHSCHEYEDPKELSWEVFPNTKSVQQEPIQKGRLFVSTGGNFGALIRHPFVTGNSESQSFDTSKNVKKIKDYSLRVIDDLDCRSEKDLRNEFWSVLMFWKSICQPSLPDPFVISHTSVRFVAGNSGIPATNQGELLLVMQTDWSIWSQFMHRMVHDDFKTRKLHTISCIVDPKSVSLYNEICK